MALPDRRAVVLTRLVANKLGVDEAALLLALSPRLVRRLRARLLAGGPDALAHGNTGRRPVHALDRARRR